MPVELLRYFTMMELVRIAGEYLRWLITTQFQRRNVLSAGLRKMSGNTHLVKDYRLSLQKNRAIFRNYGPGAGSKTGYSTISEAARIMCIRPEYGNILYNLALRHRPDTIIELGTAFGISTLYLALGNPDARIITVEGNPQLAVIATENFRHYNVKNIKVINKPFDAVIDELRGEVTANTLVFVDGNHTYDATIRYYSAFSKASILVFDDIRWSLEMRQAWNDIKNGLCGAHGIDLFRMGIIVAKVE